MTPTEIDRMLTTFNLLEKRNKLSKSLSGGMKRKLSIIIALIGGSKVNKQTKKAKYGFPLHTAATLKESADTNLRTAMELTF